MLTGTLGALVRENYSPGTCSKWPERLFKTIPIGREMEYNRGKEEFIAKRQNEGEKENYEEKLG